MEIYHGSLANIRHRSYIEWNVRKRTRLAWEVLINLPVIGDVCKQTRHDVKLVKWHLICFEKERNKKYKEISPYYDF
jgi:hypothetical protein